MNGNTNPRSRIWALGERTLRWVPGVLALLLFLGMTSCQHRHHRHHGEGPVGPQDGAGPIHIDDPILNAGGGPTAKVVRFKNESERDAGAGFIGWGSAELEGEPPEVMSEIAFFDVIPAGNNPGPLGSGYNGDAGYEMRTYIPGWLHPSMRFANLWLVDTPEFDLTVIPDFTVTIPNAMYSYHIEEVLLTLVQVPEAEDDGDPRTVSYRVDYEIKFSEWHEELFSWELNPPGSPAHGTTGVIATALKH